MARDEDTVDSLLTGVAQQDDILLQRRWRRFFVMIARRRYEVWISKRALIEHYGAFGGRARRSVTPTIHRESA